MCQFQELYTWSKGKMSKVPLPYIANVVLPQVFDTQVMWYVVERHECSVWGEMITYRRLELSQVKCVFVEICQIECFINIFKCVLITEQ